MNEIEIPEISKTQMMETQSALTKNISWRNKKERLNILLLCKYDTTNASTVIDHINSFPQYSQHNIFILSNIGNFPPEFDLNRFDVIIFHYSITIALHSYLPIKTRQAISNFEGLKMVFIQDEYRFQNKTITALNELGINVLFTCVPESEIETIYPSTSAPDLIKVNVLTGYVPENLLWYAVQPFKERKYDVSYRGRVYPYWHGQLGIEKWVIAENFLKSAKQYNLKTNISCQESDRLYGNRWVNLIKNSTAVLGVESGASYLDPDGKLSAIVECYTGLTMKKEKSSLDNYNEVYELLLKDNTNEINIRQISPRCFEAITLKTGLILYEGDYSGILKPWRHYIPLKKNHSNMDEVITTLRNQKEMAQIISQAFAEIACNDQYSYKNFIKQVDSVINQNFNSQYKTTSNPYTTESFNKKYPQNYVNPHITNNSKIDSMLTKIKSYVPLSVKLRLKKFLLNT